MWNKIRKIMESMGLVRRPAAQIVYPAGANRELTLFGLRLVVNEYMPAGQFMLVEETTIGLSIDGPMVKGIFKIDDSPPKPVKRPKAPMNSKTEQWLERWRK